MDQAEITLGLGLVGRLAPRRRGNGLKTKPSPVRSRLLTDDREFKVFGWLNEPLTRHGFRTDQWTARRVAELIHTKFGVRFHPGYLREWVMKRNYTPQKPARWARQRDSAAIGRWGFAETWIGCERVHHIDDRLWGDLRLWTEHAFALDDRVRRFDYDTPLDMGEGPCAT